MQSLGFELVSGSAAGKIGEPAERGHELARQIDHVSKLFARLVDATEGELSERDGENWSGRYVRQESYLEEL